jgi:hypothetical protein
MTATLRRSTSGRNDLSARRCSSCGKFCSPQALLCYRCSHDHAQPVTPRIAMCVSDWDRDEHGLVRHIRAR